MSNVSGIQSTKHTNYEAKNWKQPSNIPTSNQGYSEHKSTLGKYKPKNEQN